MKVIAAICIAASATCVAAQTAVMNGNDGVSGAVPVYSGTATLGPSSSSPIAVSGSNVGIGTTTPLAHFSVIGSSPGLMVGYDTTTDNLAAEDFAKVPQIFVVGDGTTNDGPGIGQLQLKINQSGGAYESVSELYLAASNAGNAHDAASGLGVPSQVVGGNVLGRIGFYGDDGTNVRTKGALIEAEVYTGHAAVSTTGVVPAALNLATESQTPIVFYTNANTQVGGLYGSSSERMRVDYNGNVGIGTTAPGATLEVNGTAKIDTSLSVGTGGITFSGQPGIQTTPWTGVLCGGDYAEAVNAKGSLRTYEPGDVLVIGDGVEGEVQKSAEPYSTMVAGIFATKPGVIGRRQSLVKDAEEIPMAMVGIVPTKVTAENGSIHRGDLLVTSSTSGYAMKGTDRSRLVGAVIGKAMGSLETGTGVIEVLVTLQ